MEVILHGLQVAVDLPTACLALGVLEAIGDATQRHWFAVDKHDAVVNLHPAEAERVADDLFDVHIVVAQTHDGGV